MTLTSDLQQAILPGRILSVQIGLFRTAVLVETDEGLRCGITATLVNPDTDRREHPMVRQAGHLHELSALELVALAESPSYTETAVGLAAINALLPRTPADWVELNAEQYLIEHSAGKNVAVIGHFPFINRLRPHTQNLWVLELQPRDGDLPASAEPEILPQADVIAVTATTLINHTYDELIGYCRKDACVVMLGPSTPLSPVLYDYGVDVLAGTIITHPQPTMMGISQGISLQALKQSGWIQFVTMTQE